MPYGLPALTGRGRPCRARFLPIAQSSTTPPTGERDGFGPLSVSRMRRSTEQYRGALLHHSRWSDLGFHSRQLASEHFTTVFPGYRTLTDHPATLNAMAWVLQNRVEGGAVLSHTTAALFWAIPFPLALDDGISALRDRDLVERDGVEQIPSLLADASLRTGAHLPMLRARVAQGGSSGVAQGAVLHRQHPGPTAALGPLVVSAPSEVLRELATMMPLWDVVAAADAVLGPSSRCPGENPEGLTGAVASARGRPGTPRTLDALRLARSRVRSPGETIFRLLLARAGFPAPSLNHPVRVPLTGSIREIDLAWEEIGFGLEYDGDGHRLTKGQWREDEVRRDELASCGWTLSRANGKDLFRPLRILLRLRRTMAERGMRVPDEQRVRQVVAEVGARGLSLRIARRQW